MTTRYSHRGRRTLKRLGLCVTIGVTALFLATAIVILALLIKTDTTGFNVNDTDFPLYKNSRFRECSTTPPSEPVNCTLVLTDLGPNDGNSNDERDWYTQNAQLGRRFLSKAEYNGWPTNSYIPKYDWCSLASCLKEYKIIPSKARESAYGSPPMTLWFYTLVTTLLGLKWIHNLYFSEMHNKGDCRVGPMDYISLLIDIGSFGFWMYNFARLVSDPSSYQPASLLGWIAAWRMVVAVFYCPFDCIIGDTTRKILVTTFSIIAFVQFIATCISLKMKWYDHIPPPSFDFSAKYDCLVSELRNAPGYSPCSPEDICSKAWLFSNPGWISQTGTDGAFDAMKIFYLIVFFMFLGVAVLPIFLVLSERMGCMDWDFGTEQLKFLAFIPYAFLVLTFVIFGGIILGFYFSSDTLVNRDAPVAYDVTCQVAHIALSPWKYYLDIHDETYPIRIARMILNA